MVQLMFFKKKFTYEEIPPNFIKRVRRAFGNTAIGDFKILRNKRTIYVLREWDRFYIRNAVSMLNGTHAPCNCGKN